MAAAAATPSLSSSSSSEVSQDTLGEAASSSASQTVCEASGTDLEKHLIIQGESEKKRGGSVFHAPQELKLWVLDPNYICEQTYFEHTLQSDSHLACSASQSPLSIVGSPPVMGGQQKDGHDQDFPRCVRSRGLEQR